MPKISLTAKIENLEKFIQFVSGFAEGEGFNPKRIKEIELATEEALVNIFNYAYSDGNRGQVQVRCRMDEKTGLNIELTDQGPPFDFNTLSEPDLNATIAGRPIGGLGVFFIKKMMDDIKYRRDGEKNILTLIIHK